MCQLCAVQFGPVQVVAPGSPWHLRTVVLELESAAVVDILPVEAPPVAAVSVGWIDIHAWSWQPQIASAESLHAMAARAQRGGYTHLLVGGWYGWSDPSILSFLQKETRDTQANLLFLASWANEKGKIAPIESLRAAGAFGWSLPLTQLMPWHTLAQALSYLRYVGGPVFVLPFWEGASGEKGVPEAPELALAGWEGIPDYAETVALHAIIALHRRHGGELVVGPITTAAGLTIVQAHDLVAFTGITYAAASAAELLSYQPFWKVHPPLRSNRDQSALRAALSKRQILLASWDAQVPAEEKNREWSSAEVGHPTLEVVAPLLWAILDAEHPPAERLSVLVSLLAEAPRKLLGLSPFTIEKGMPLDFTIFRIQEPAQALAAPWQGFTSALQVLGTIRCLADAHSLRSQIL